MSDSGAGAAVGDGAVMYVQVPAPVPGQVLPANVSPYDAEAEPWAAGSAVPDLRWNDGTLTSWPMWYGWEWFRRPYLWGGGHDVPGTIRCDGYDCSGWVQAVLAWAWGVPVRGTAADLAGMCVVPSTVNHPCLLLAFRGRPASHVGLVYQQPSGRWCVTESGSQGTTQRVYDAAEAARWDYLGALRAPGDSACRMAAATLSADSSLVSGADPMAAFPAALGRADVDLRPASCYWPAWWLGLVR